MPTPCRPLTLHLPCKTPAHSRCAPARSPPPCLRDMLSAMTRAGSNIHAQAGACLGAEGAQLNVRGVEDNPRVGLLPSPHTQRGQTYTLQHLAAATSVDCLRCLLVCGQGTRSTDNGAAVLGPLAEDARPAALCAAPHTPEEIPNKQLHVTHI